MENILKKATELYDILVDKSRRIGVKETDMKKVSEELSAKNKFLSELETDLKEREVEVKKVENVVELGVEGRRLKAENVVTVNRIRGEQKKLDEQRSAMKIEGSTEKNEYIEKNKVLNAGWIQLRKEQEKLRKDIVDYKDKVLAKMAAGV